LQQQQQQQQELQPCFHKLPALFVCFPLPFLTTLSVFFVSFFPAKGLDIGDTAKRLRRSLSFSFFSSSPSLPISES
jgi:hypothetical protein